VREIRLLRSRWRGLETGSRLGLHGHERGNPGYRQDIDLTDHRASPRPYQAPHYPLSQSTSRAWSHYFPTRISNRIGRRYLIGYPVNGA
jgi:hypothetical protein